VTDSPHPAPTPGPPQGHNRVSALRGWPRLRFRIEAAALLFAIRARVSARATAPLFRRVTSAVEDATMVTASEAFVPEGVHADLDLSYGRRPELRADVFRPEGGAPGLPLLVWIHGGGWVSGTKDDRRPFLRALAAQGLVVVGVGYTVAPELRYPAQVEQVAQAVAWARTHAAEWGADGDALVIGGDSAGAHIGGQLARAIRDRGYAQRAGIVLPAIDPDALRAVVLAAGVFRFSQVGGPGPMRRLGDFMVRAYTGRRDYATAEALAPASLIDDMAPTFPPAMVIAGNGDWMLHDSVDLAVALEGSGVPVETVFSPEDQEPALPHGYSVDLRWSQARDLLAPTAAFIRRWAGR